MKTLASELEVKLQSAANSAAQAERGLSARAPDKEELIKVVRTLQQDIEEASAMSIVLEKTILALES